MSSPGSRLQFIWHWPVYIRLEWPFIESDYYGVRDDSVEYRIVLSFDHDFFRRFHCAAGEWPRRTPPGKDNWAWVRWWTFGPLEIRKFLP